MESATSGLLTTFRAATEGKSQEENVREWFCTGRNHSFCVGIEGLLAHNQSWCDLLKAKNLDKPDELVALVKKLRIDISRIHGHHIVMKEAAFESSQWARDLLAKYDIPLLGTKEELRAAANNEIYNLAYAINGLDGIHSGQYSDWIWTRLSTVERQALARGANRQQVAKEIQDELLWMREQFHEGNAFWNNGNGSTR